MLCRCRVAFPAVSKVTAEERFRRRHLQWKQRLCEEVRSFSHGTVLRSPRHPNFWEYNCIRLERPMEAGEMTAAADRELVGCAHRLVEWMIPIPRSRGWNLRHERPDNAYFKQVLRYLRQEFGVAVQHTPKRLPYVPTEQRSAASRARSGPVRRVTDIVMFKTLLYIGCVSSNSSAPRTVDVDLDGCRNPINQSKGAKDRHVPYAAAFKETLALPSS